ncbi:glycosyltransferase family 4 protein [bacterium]|nr:glycosyltransferase family 4 protein [bacterium]
MKVLLINSEKGLRGGEYQTLELALGLINRGCTVSMLASADSEIVGKLDNRIEVVQTGFEFLPFRTPLAINRFVRRVRPDIIHVQTSRAHTHARLAKLINREFPPLVVSRRVAFAISGGLGGFIKYRTGISHYIPISKAIERILINAGIDKDKITVIPSGVDIEKFKRLKPDKKLQREWNLDENDFIIGTVAPFEKEKGYSILLDAAEIVLNKYPSCKFVFVGEGSLEKEIETLIKGKGLVEKVILKPAEPPLENILSLFDVFVLASNMEGLSTALIASIASGLPSLASDTGGIPEVFGEDGGILISPDDREGFAEAICDFIQDKTKRIKFSENARLRAKRFDISETVDRTFEVYRRIIAG